LIDILAKKVDTIDFHIRNVLIAKLGALHKETALLPRVKTFLESIERNSIKTRKTYETGLAYFNDFLRNLGSLLALVH